MRTASTMRFGKHRGEPVSVVPTAYLAWVVDVWAEPPEYVLRELQRRQGSGGAAESIVAAAALSPPSRPAKPAPRQEARSRRRTEPRRSCVASRPVIGTKPRAGGEKRTETTIRIVGENFDRLRAEFLESGGNVESCPF